MFRVDPQHVELANMISPLANFHRDNLNTEVMTTAKGFLDMLVNTRWVIIQDRALFVGKFKRGHFIFDTFLEIFQSDLFKDFITKLMKYIDEAEYLNDAKVNHVLPWSFSKFDAHTMVIKKLREDMIQKREKDEYACRGKFSY